MLLKSILAKLSTAAVAALFLNGCAANHSAPRHSFIRNNPALAKDAVELYEVSVDQWVDLETSNGLGKLAASAAIWRKGAVQISDPQRQQEAQRAFSVVVEESNRRWIAALIGMHEIRSKMGPHDRLFYCRKEGDIPDLFGRFYIVREDGRIREKVYVSPTWGLVNDLMWQDLLASRKHEE